MVTGLLVRVGGFFGCHDMVMGARDRGRKIERSTFVRFKRCAIKREDVGIGQCEQ